MWAGAALVLPWCDTDSMNQHLLEMKPQAVDDGARVVLILDQAGRHVAPKLSVPDNVRLLFLPSRSPVLDPIEDVWQVYEGQLAVEPHLHRLRGNRRSRLCRPEQARRATLEDDVHWTARVGIGFDQCTLVSITAFKERLCC
ncbi:hypothetical protein GOD36_30565 [Sinorhizobium medicae]|nr:hypothetical protein [Sinorhizobium medicae]MDX0827879.1 hypothetical protein [Sinorhizobium medicae]RVJ19579.1 hypothetical protein CN179_29340 [Sinorhizobium medicae]